jgi:radical SAM superfamily enzyme YgiQ (UPF0313 family)
LSSPEEAERAGSNPLKILVLVTPEENYMVASIHKSLDHKREHRPLLGVLSVATYLKRHRPHHEIKFVDCRALELSFEDMVEVVREFEPDVVGLTSLTFNYYDTLQAAKRIKATHPSAKTCLGGWHVSLYPEETLTQDAVDYVVFGEGELSFVDLVDKLEDGEEPLGVQGVGFKRDGKSILGPPRPPNRTLDELPFPDFDLSDISLYSHLLGKGNIVLPLESSRGCPFACTFCDIRRSRYRRRSSKLICDEMEKWTTRGIRSFFFVDDNITVNKKLALELFQDIRDRKLDVDFKVSSRIDGLNEEVMVAMVEAGVSRVSIGIESSKQKYLDFMEKGIKTEQIEETLALAHRVGLPVFAFMMLGLPGQTKKEMLDEADFLKMHRVRYASFSILTVYPKTELYRVAKESGDLIDDPWPEFAANPRSDVQAPYMNRLYSPEELKRIQLQVTRRFYFTPRTFYRELRETTSWGGSGSGRG